MAACQRILDLLVCMYVKFSPIMLNQRPCVHRRTGQFLLKGGGWDIFARKKFDSAENKKAELSQRWPHDALYIWMPWKFSGVPGYAHGPATFPQIVNVLFLRSIVWKCVQNLKLAALPVPEIIGGYTKNLGSFCIRPRSLFSKSFNGFLFGCECIGQIWSPYSFTPSWDNSDWRFGWGLRTPNLWEEEAVGGRRWYRSKERWRVPIGPP